MNQEESPEDRGSDKYIRLCKVFHANSTIIPDLYVSNFVIFNILTNDEKDLIESKVTQKEKHLQMAICLSQKSDAVLQKLKAFAKKNNHVDLYDALVKQGF